MNSQPVTVAGATGKLGFQIVNALIQRQAQVRALVRCGTLPEKVEAIRKLGADVRELDWGSRVEIEKACSGSSCVVSALSGLREVIVDLQSDLLKAAVDSGVPRFIPSDFAMDFTKIPAGSNRNLDFRREFQKRLDQAPIAATSILNGAFADMLTGQAPFILFKFKRVLCWGNPDQLMDFTTIEDTAAFTASAALDSKTPRFLRISGDQISASDLANTVSEITGREFRIFQPGSLRMLSILIKIIRKLRPDEDQVYPPWQGMQYFHGMFSGDGKLETLDNDRYPEIRWTKVKNVLSSYLGSKN